MKSTISSWTLANGKTNYAIYVSIFSALLCGLNGYITFIDENIAIKTVQWQVSESGCYEYFDGTLPTNNTEMRMTKRSADALQGNCSDHMTGLAAATFGLFAKLTEQFEEETFWKTKFIENTFELTVIQLFELFH